MVTNELILMVVSMSTKIKYSWITCNLSFKLYSILNFTVYCYLVGLGRLDSYLSSIITRSSMAISFPSKSLAIQIG